MNTEKAKVSPLYLQLIEGMHRDKLKINDAKLARHGSIDIDDHGFIDFPEFTFEPETCEDGLVHGCACIGRNFRRFLNEMPKYINPNSALACCWVGTFDRFAPLQIADADRPHELDETIQKYRITQAVSALAKAEAYSAAAVESGGTLKVHIKVDTGMSRLGFLVREGHFDTGVESIAAACALPGLEAEGIFTHFAVSDEDDRDSEAYTRAQFDVFTRVLDALAAGGRTFAIRHCANSGALARYPEMYLDMVRPGIALYGVGADAQRLDLRPVMSLKSSVSTIKTFDPGTDVSYGRTFRTQGRTRIGVLPIGYADGFFRGLSNRMSVVTAQGPAPQRGRICMDMSMIDLTDLPDVKVGDEVEIFGRRQRVDDLAAILNTIPYELTCAVSKRVPRVYIEGGKIVERSLRLL